MSNVFIIAEAGVNHNGEMKLALKLCDVAKEAGADAVKFQTFKTANLLIKKSIKAQYQKEFCADDSQFEMIKKLELSQDEFCEIKQYCGKIGIQFLSTPDDEESLDFLITLDMSTIKIGSGEITNPPFLDCIGAKKKPVILSTGMSSLSEIDFAINRLRKQGCHKISLLHCTTSYPCPIKDVNLRSMKTLKDQFNLPTGLSDHTQGTDIAIAAVAMGATIIEKHFTTDQSLPGPDHKASLNPEQLKELVSKIRMTEIALGSANKEPTADELENKKYIQRSIVAIQNIKKGDIFTRNNISTKRANGIGILAVKWDDIIGKISPENYAPDDLILMRN